MKALAGGPSLDELWPNIKVPVAGVEARLEAGVELLGLPNRLGAGAVVEAVLEVLAMKPKGGAALVSVALCPKLNEGFGVSAAGVAATSGGLPKVKLGLSCSLGGSGLLKEKPPKDGAGEASGSLLAAENRNPEVIEGASFTSGFPKVNEGAAGSFSAGAPKAEPPRDAVAVELDSVGVPNTGADVVLTLATAVVEASLLLFSWEAAPKLKAEDGSVVVVGAAAVLASDVDCPKVKPPPEGLLSMVSAPMPKAMLPPNLKPAPMVGGSAFLSLSTAVEESPNLKLSVEAPNLKPPVVEESEEEVPNLKPTDDEEELEFARVLPNLKLPEPEDESEDEPPLKPPESDVPNDEDPKAVGSTLAPGLTV